MNALLAHLRRHRPLQPAASDGELLARYAVASDESAFAELVLRCPEGTLSAILARALARLRRQLAGADPNVLLAAAGVTLPAGLASAAVRAAGAFRTASLSAAGVSPAVADLTRGVLRMFWVKKAAAAGLILAAVIGTGLGIGLGTGSQAIAQPTPKSTPAADDLDARIKQLEAELAKLKRERDAAQQQKRVVEVLDRLNREMARARQEPYLEVVLSRAVGQVAEDVDPCEVVEYDRGGKKVGTVRCSNVEMLKRFLTRSHKDPAGPKRITVSAPADLPYKKLTAALDAIKAAELENVEMRIDKLPPAGPVGRTDPPGYVIESPDVLTIGVSIRDKAKFGGGGLRPLRYPVNGEYLIHPDGTVYLGAYGPTRVSGLTIDQATAEVRKHMVGHDLLRGSVAADDLVVVLDVKRYNSKCYYVITDFAGTGAQVVRLPVTGKETVRDAVTNVAGLATKATDVRVELLRKAGGREDVLPVDWVGITRQGRSETNYQLLPGDRIYIQEK